jgi:hypothetical protein
MSLSRQKTVINFFRGGAQTERKRQRGCKRVQIYLTIFSTAVEGKFIAELPLNSSPVKQKN